MRLVVPRQSTAACCCWTQGHLDADLPVALVSFERLGPLLDNVGLGQGLHHLDKLLGTVTSPPRKRNRVFDKLTNYAAALVTAPS